MKIMIMTINYHADKQLNTFLHSLIHAKEFEQHNIDVKVVDNSQKIDQDVKELQNKLRTIHKHVNVISDGTNSGYFGSINLAQKILDETYDILIYCNPDIEFDSNFLKELNVIYSSRPSSIVAPAIISKLDGFDQNPLYLERLPIQKIKLLKKINGNLVTYCIYQFLGRMKEILFKKKFNHQEYKQKEIYAPHGAIFIFTDISFFKSLPLYEPFLFGEEIFIAEEARNKNKKIIYFPNIKVYDERHASIGLLGCDKVREYYLNSIEYLLDRYYK